MAITLPNSGSINASTRIEDDTLLTPKQPSDSPVQFSFGGNPKLFVDTAMPPPGEYEKSKEARAAQIDANIKESIFNSDSFYKKKDTSFHKDPATARKLIQNDYFVNGSNLGDVPVSGIIRDLERRRIADKDFGGLGRDDEMLFNEQIVKRYKDQKASEDFNYKIAEAGYAQGISNPGGTDNEMAMGKQFIAEQSSDVGFNKNKTASYGLLYANAALFGRERTASFRGELNKVMNVAKVGAEPWTALYNVYNTLSPSDRPKFEEALAIRLRTANPDERKAFFLDADNLGKNFFGSKFWDSNLTRATKDTFSTFGRQALDAAEEVISADAIFPDSGGASLYTKEELERDRKLSTSSKLNDRKRRAFARRMATKIQQEYNPIQSSWGDGGKPGWWEDAALKTPGVVGTSLTMAIPVVGFPIMGLAMMSQAQEIMNDRLIQDYGMSEDQALETSSGLAPLIMIPQMAAEYVGYKLFMGRLPIFSKAIDAMGDRITNAYLRFGAKAVTIGVAETGVELFQDATNFAVQDIAAALSKDIGGVQWLDDGAKKGVLTPLLGTSPEIFVTMFPLALLGAARGLNIESRNRAFANTPRVYREAFGIQRDDNLLIEAAATQGDSSLSTAVDIAWFNRDGSSLEAALAKENLETQLALAKQIGRDGEADSFAYPIFTNSRSGIAVTDGTTGEFIGEADNIPAAIGIARKHTESLDNLKAEHIAAIAGQLQMNRVSSSLDRNSLLVYDMANDVSAADVSEEMRKRLEAQAARMVAAKQLSSETADADLAKLILGFSETEYSSDGERLTINRLFANANSTTPFHETGHGMLRDARRKGRITAAEIISVLRGLDSLNFDEQGNPIRKRPIKMAGDKMGTVAEKVMFIPEGVDDSDVTELMIDEAMSELYEVEIFRRRDESLSKFGLSRTAFSRNITALTNLGVANAAVLKVLTFIGVLRQRHGVTLMRVAVIRRAIREGRFKLEEYEQFFDQLLGIEEQTEFDAQAAAEQADMMDEDPFSLGFAPDDYLPEASDTSFSIDPSQLSMKAPPGVIVYLTDSIPLWNLPKSKTDSLGQSLTDANRKEFFSRLDVAIANLMVNPKSIGTATGWVKFLREAGISGDVPMPPSGLLRILTKPKAFIKDMSGGFHGNRTVPNVKKSADDGLASVRKMRRTIGKNKAPNLMVTALTSLWGINSRSQPPIDQEAMWLRLVSDPKILKQIKLSIDGKFTMSDKQWLRLVEDVRQKSMMSSKTLGNGSTANSNAFHLMLKNLNGKWDKASQLYAEKNASRMNRKFWELLSETGLLGIKNKVQRFIGLTFGINGVIIDRWQYVQFWLPTLMEAKGVTKAQDYWKYDVNGTALDPLSIYDSYNKFDANELLSLAMYEAFDAVLDYSIQKSPELKAFLGASANAGGLHWHSWNAIKNEAVGHSSLDLTYDLQKQFAGNEIIPADVLAMFAKNTYYTSDNENEIRITNGKISSSATAKKIANLAAKIKVFEAERQRRKREYGFSISNGQLGGSVSRLFGQGVVQDFSSTSRLTDEITGLRDQIDEMYTSGATDGVEDLEVKLENLLEKLDTDLEAIEMESVADDDSSESDVASPSQGEQLVISWYRWTGRGIGQESEELRELYPTFGAFVRGTQGDIIGMTKDIGIIAEGITDEEIEDGAKEEAAAYEKRRDTLKSFAINRDRDKIAMSFSLGKGKPFYASSNVHGLRVDKTAWLDAGATMQGARDIVSKYYKTINFSGIDKESILVPVPSTLGRNIIPDAFAEKLAGDFGNTVEKRVVGVAQSRTEAKKKLSFFAKEQDAVVFNPSQFTDSLKGKKITIVEDVHNTGESWIAFANMLIKSGADVVGVATLASSEQRLTSERDIERLAVKVAAHSGESLDVVLPLMQSVFNGTFKQLFNKAEAAATRSRDSAIDLLTLARKGDRGNRFKNPLRIIDKNQGGLLGDQQESFAFSIGVRDGFYSTLLKVIREKMPARATVAQYMATLDPSRGSGVTADEIKWSGLEESLRSVGLPWSSGEFSPPIEERMVDRDTLIEVLEKFNEMFFRQDTYVPYPMTMTPANLGIMRNPRALYQGYTLPNGSDYKETIMAMRDTVPKRRAANYTVRDENHSLLHFHPSKASAIAEVYAASNRGERWTWNENKFMSSHYQDAEGYIAHMRTQRMKIVSPSGDFLLRDGYPLVTVRSGGFASPTTLHAVEYQNDAANRYLKYRDNLLSPFMYNDPAKRSPVGLIGQDFKDLSEDQKAEVTKQARLEFSSTPLQANPSQWLVFLFKRQLRDAVMGDYDAVSWSPGQVIQDIYDKSSDIVPLDKIELYDKIAVREIGKYVKKWGAEVVKSYVSITNEPVFANVPPSEIRGDVGTVYFQDGNNNGEFFQTENEVIKAMDKSVNLSPVWMVRLNDQMIESVNNGQASFSLGTAMSSIIGNEAFEFRDDGMSMDEKKEQVEDFAFSLDHDSNGNLLIPGTAIQIISQKVKDSIILDDLKIKFLGQPIKDASDFGMKMMVLRNPRFETFYMVAMRGNQSVAAYAVTSRAPHHSSFGINEDSRYNLDDMANFLEQHNATGYYFAHNHPSGITNPSRDDLILTSWTDANLSPLGYKMMGHIIINHDTFAVIDDNGNAWYESAFPSTVDKYAAEPGSGIGDLLGDPNAVYDRLSGKVIHTKEIEFPLGYAQQIRDFVSKSQDPNMLLGIVTNIQLNAVAFVHGSIDDFAKITRRQLMDYGREQGGQRLFVHLKESADYTKTQEAFDKLVPLMEQGLISDVLVEEHNGASVLSLLQFLKDKGRTPQEDKFWSKDLERTLVQDESFSLGTLFSGGRVMEGGLATPREIAFTSEYDVAINDFANNANDTAYIAGDVDNFDFLAAAIDPPILVNASPPCQNFSLAGSMQGANVNDAKGANAVAKMIRTVRPFAVTVENVPKYKSTALYQTIIDALDDGGYNHETLMVNAADYGAAQERKRMLIRAVREGDLPPLPAKSPAADWFPLVQDLIEDAPEATIPPDERMRLDRMIEQGKLDPRLPILSQGASAFKGTTMAVNSGNPSNTIIAGKSKIKVVLPDGTVKLGTTRMMARLMGLPDTFKLPENYYLAKKILGNGIHSAITRQFIEPMMELPQATQFPSYNPKFLADAKLTAKADKKLASQNPRVSEQKEMSFALSEANIPRIMGDDALSRTTDPARRNQMMKSIASKFNDLGLTIDRIQLLGDRKATGYELRQAANARQEMNAEAAIEKIHASYGDLFYNEDLVRLKAQPVHELLSDPNSPLRGLLQSKTAWKKGKSEEQLTAGYGDYDGSDGISRSVFGGTMAPDVAAQYAFDNYLIKAPFTDDLWQGLAKEQAFVFAMRDSHNKMMQEVLAAKRAAKAEANEWLATTKANQTQIFNPRNEILRALRMYEAIRSSMPTEIRGQMGGAVALASMTTNEAKLKFLKEKLKQADVLLEKFLREQFDRQWKNLLRRSKPSSDAPGEVPTGNIDANAFEVLRIAEHAMTLGFAEAEKLADLHDEMAEDPDATAAEETRNYVIAGMIRLTQNWTKADAARREQAVLEGEKIFNGGLRDINMKKALRRERLDRLMRAGMAGLPIQGDRINRELKAQKMEGSGVATTFEKTKSLAWEIMSFGEIVDSIFGSGNELAKWLRSGEIKASNSYEDMFQDKASQLEGLFDRLAGGTYKGLQLRFSMANDRTISAVDLLGKTQKFSETQAVVYLLMARQEDGRRHLGGISDSMGNHLSDWGYSESQTVDIEAQLSINGQALLAFLGTKYGSEYDRINDVFIRVRNIPLPRHKFYSPLSVAGANSSSTSALSDPSTGMPLQGGTSPGSLKNRSSTAIAEPVFVDAIDQYLSHVRQMEHFIAYAEFAKDALVILGKRDIRNAIAANAGTDAASVLSGFMNYFAAGGIANATAGKPWAIRMNSMLGNMAGASLVGSVSVLAMQTLQSAAAMYKIPVSAYLKRAAMLSAGKLNYSAALDSDYIQRRLSILPPVVRDAMQNLSSGKPSRIKYWSSILAQSIGAADAYFTATTYAILYDFHLMLGRQLSMPDPHSYATGMAEKITDEVAQPMRIGAKSWIEVGNSGNPFFRIGFNFSSAPRQMIGIITAEAMSPEEKGLEKAQNVSKAIAITWGVSGVLMALFRAAMRDLKDDEDKELFDDENWDLKSLMLSAAFGPIGGIPYLGDIAESLAYSGAGVYRPGGGLFDAAIGKIGQVGRRWYKQEFDLMKDAEGILLGVSPFSSTAAGLKGFVKVANDAINIIKNISK